jgi:Mn-dependent DtxR family transcriptional regulator
MQLTQLQDEVIDAAYSQAVDPSVFARLLLHDLEDVHDAINELVGKGLLEGTEQDTYCLTDQGQALHRAQGKAHRAAVVSRTRSWQRA